MMRGLLKRVGQLDHGSLVIRPSHEGDTGGEIVGGKAGRNRDGGNEYEERVQMRGALGILKRRILAVLVKRRLMLD